MEEWQESRRRGIHVCMCEWLGPVLRSWNSARERRILEKVEECVRLVKEIMGIKLGSLLPQGRLCLYVNSPTEKNFSTFVSTSVGYIYFFPLGARYLRKSVCESKIQEFFRCSSSCRKSSRVSHSLSSPSGRAVSERLSVIPETESVFHYISTMDR